MNFTHPAERIIITALIGLEEINQLAVTTSRLSPQPQPELGDRGYRRSPAINF
jgi:hypothetical protein